MAYTEQDIQNQIKPLSKNGFVAFFQRIGRWWLSTWYGFADKHPKLSKWIYMIFFFIVFSEGVTIWQLLVMLFLPYAFSSMAGTEFIWPQVKLWEWGELVAADNYATHMVFGIFNEPIKLNADGTQSVFGGLGNFIAFEIAVFTAQCINFPLQRNITFRSHGNPWYQAMWYFIGWILISILVNATWGFINPIVTHWQWNEFLYTLLKMFITGGLSMFVFFFIFLIIFPDNEKLSKKATKKLEAMRSSDATEAEFAKQEEKAKKYQYAALLTRTEKEESTSKTLANAKALKYFAIKKAKIKAGEEEKHEASLKKAFDEACEAIAAKEKAEVARKEALALKA